MTHDLDDILDDLFHGCAFAAYLDQAALEGGPPDSEATRRPAPTHTMKTRWPRGMRKKLSDRRDTQCPAWEVILIERSHVLSSGEYLDIAQAHP